MQPSTLVYRTENYSFDEVLAQSVAHRRLSRLATARLLFRGHWDVIELNEPTMVKVWPSLVIYIASARLGAFIRRSKTEIVCYAIDNADVSACLLSRKHVPRFISKWVMRRLIRRYDRVAFGTQGARQAYAEYDTHLDRHVDTAVIEQLPSVCDCGNVDDYRRPSVLFVSSLERRKGISELMAAWDDLLYEGAYLTIIGKGPLEPEVSAWAASRADVSLVIDPPRAAVHEALRSHKVVSLLSQPQDCWREQVGLPIVEGLSHGCLVVASEETGVASWLSEHGHFVVRSGASKAEIAEKLRSALDSDRSPKSITDQLPHRHMRVAADDWLRG